MAETKEIKLKCFTTMNRGAKFGFASTTIHIIAQLGQRFGDCSVKEHPGKRLQDLLPTVAEFEIYATDKTDGEQVGLGSFFGSYWDTKVDVIFADLASFPFFPCLTFYKTKHQKKQPS